MLKAFIMCGDGVCPDYIFEKSELYPNLTKLVQQGASASYAAYVQKGYKDSYLSEMNWASIYTGLPPWEHRIAEKTHGSRMMPEMRHFDKLNPFWEILNDAGYTVGLWNANGCFEPISIEGYVVSSKYGMIETPVECREAPRTIQICEKEQSIRDYFKGMIPPRQYPKTLKQQGYCFEELKTNPGVAEEVLEQYHFEEAIDNFEEELRYYFDAMKKVQREHPVDVLYFYTPTTDLIAHCCMYCDDNEVLIKSYQLLDKYLGEIVEEFEPEYTIFLSDHGMVNFKELVKCSNQDIQREAFGARDEVLWLKNGYIAFEAYNGALLFTAHGYNGTFIAAGKGIKHIKLNEMQTLDIYPTLLEIMGAEVPKDRKGWVLDIFEKEIINRDKLLKEQDIQYEPIALIQCHEPGITDIVINELKIENRFSEITIVGEEKYREIFLNNPRVSSFVEYSQYDARMYDSVYCSLYNHTTKVVHHIKVK